MLNHPQNAQAAIDQRWDDVRLAVARDRRAWATQPVSVALPTRLQRAIFRLAVLRQSLGDWQMARRPGGKMARHPATS